ncbi:MAG: DUF445 family protein [Victivallales bacterium]|nr:DUF445 family protein [Victivallales bacterium]
MPEELPAPPQEQNPGWIRSRWTILANWKNNRGNALWAGLELLCAPLSLLTVCGLLARIVCTRFLGHPFPPAWNNVFQILLTAALGYGTNFIAIEMLFKPFEPGSRHWLRWLTLGLWKQGLVPSNKPQIAVEIGRQVEQKLLPTDQIVEEMGGYLLQAIDDGKAAQTLRTVVNTALANHKTDILAYLEALFTAEMDRQFDVRLTPAKVRDFLLNVGIPAINQPQTRTAAARKILEEMARMSPAITQMFKQKTVDWIGNLGQGFMTNILASVVDGIPWTSVESQIRETIQSEKSRTMLEERLADAPEVLREWLDTPEGQERLKECSSQFKGRMRGYLLEIFREYVPSLLEQMEHSDSLWAQIEHELLPSLKPHLERLLQTQGKAWLAENLKLGARVTQAIERQDIRQFYNMINELSAKHLGAIQVLGYILGALVGLVQLL